MFTKLLKPVAAFLRRLGVHLIICLEYVPGCEPGPGDMLQSLTKGVGSSMWVGKDSGFMERGVEHLAHKCIGTSSCNFCSQKFYQ